MRFRAVIDNLKEVADIIISALISEGQENQPNIEGNGIFMVMDLVPTLITTMNDIYTRNFTKRSDLDSSDTGELPGSMVVDNLLALEWPLLLPSSTKGIVPTLVSLFGEVDLMPSQVRH
jgi:hypothetical protein